MESSCALTSETTEELTIDEKDETQTSKKWLGGDLANILFLMFLYILQGVPIGLLHSIQFILTFKSVSYADQGTFSLAGWPFTLKLLWAPFVDTFYSDRLGRRKSWLVPVQYLMGAILIGTAPYVQRLLGDEATQAHVHEDILWITVLFTVFCTLAATQDIAVDAWGISMLSQQNLEWASICNNGGATIGIIIGNSLFLILNSPDISNAYLRSPLSLEPQTHGLVSLQSFMIFFGIIFILSTTLILIFKREKSDNNLHMDHSITDTFQALWSIVKLRPMRKLIAFLLTLNIAFAFTRIKALKLIEQGVPKATLGLLNIPFQFIQILAPILLVNILNIKNPLRVFFRLYPLRMAMTAVLAAWIYVTPWFIKDNSQFYMYICVFAALNGVYSLLIAALDMLRVYFYAKISDKTIGGTYMTLLHTVSNMGQILPLTLAFYLLELFTVRTCKDNTEFLGSGNSTFAVQPSFEFNNTCTNTIENEDCMEMGGKCEITSDAFYSLSAVFLGIGLVWWVVFKRILRPLQKMPKSMWSAKVRPFQLENGDLIV